MSTQDGTSRTIDESGVPQLWTAVYFNAVYQHGRWATETYAETTKAIGGAQ